MAPSTDNATANAALAREDGVSDDDDYHYDDISDESSFYGDEETRASLEQAVADYDPTTYWSTQHLSLSLSTLAAANVAAAASSKIPTIPPTHNPKKPLYNPYSSNPLSARQLSEPPSDFLSRLPPLTTLASKHGPWIYIANPFSLSHSTFHPTSTSQNLTAFSTAGTRILESLSNEILSLEKECKGRPQTLLNSKLTKLRNVATGEILSAAKENGVRTGKWMLFPSEGEVDGVWKVVVEGTVEGKLGVSAKVATRDDIGVVGEGGGTGGDGGTGGGRSRGGGRERLVCVYTEDFDDEGDVLRVLKKLVEMGLAAGGQARGLYYKCDAFTHLGIESSNEWGLKASLYASKDLLAAEKEKKGKGKGKVTGSKK